MLAAIALFALAPALDLPPVSFTRWMNAAEPPAIESLKGKVVVFHVAPGFCCGYDYSARKLKTQRDRFPKDVKIIGVCYVEPDQEQLDIWKDVKRKEKIDWPIGIDSDSKFADSLYPAESPKYSYVFFDRHGKRRFEKLDSLDQVKPIIEQLVAEK